jgi:hypothetical protein
MTGFEILLWALAAVPFVLLRLVVLAASYGAYALRRTIDMAASKACPNSGRPIGRPAVLGLVGPGALDQW